MALDFVAAKGQLLAESAVVVTQEIIGENPARCGGVNRAEVRLLTRHVMSRAALFGDGGVGQRYGANQSGEKHVFFHGRVR